MTRLRKGRFPSVQVRYTTADLWGMIAGIPKAAREDGVRHLPQSDVIL